MRFLVVAQVFLKTTEKGRFELPEAFTSSDFKSDAIDHSATSPIQSVKTDR